MGNNTSQPSEYDEVPQYRYHEAVLREARTRALPTVYLSDDDEQFYSAEEDESSRSVTPERERPESSSGGEQNSDNDSDEAETTSPGADHHVERQNLVRTERSCGRCNVSIAQEHDSINIELEAIARQNVLSDQDGPTPTSSPQKRNLSISSPQEQVLPKRLKVHTKSSPFQPICSGNRQQRLISRLSETLTPAKRKIQTLEGEDEENASPCKKALAEGPPKRVRLGYFDSSDSDNSDIDRRRRSRRKRAKLSREKRSDRRSAEPSSEEDKYKRLENSTRVSIEDEESNSEEEEEEAETGGGKFYHHEGKTGKFAPNSNIVNNDYEAPNAFLSARARKLRERISEKNLALDNRNHNINHKSHSQPKNRSFDNANHSTQVQRPDQPTGRNRSARSDDTPDRNLSADSDSEQSPEAREGRGKMGDLGVRNAQGKVLPLQQFRTPALPSSPPKQPNSKSQTPEVDHSLPSKVDSSSNLSNISKRLRRASGAFVRLQQLPSYLTQSSASLEKEEDHNIKTVTVSQGSEEIKNGHLQSGAGVSNNSSPSKSSSSPAKRTSSDNPFQDVELTPPSKLPHFSLCADAQIRSDAIDNVVRPNFMETDESQYEAANGTVSSQLELKSIADRPKLRAKRSLGKTVAERFRNFWTKKNIGSNLKSIFSKSKAENSPSSERHVLSSRNKATENLNCSSQDISLCDLNDLNSSTSATLLSSDDPTRPSHVLSSSLPSQSFANQAELSHQSHAHHTPSPSRQVGNQQDQHLGSNSLIRERTGASINSTPVENQRQSGRRTSSRLSALGSGHKKSATLVKHLSKKSQFQAVSVQLAESLVVTVNLGELADQATEGLVNWTDGSLAHKVTECSRAVAARAGALFTTGCQDYLENKDGPLEAPDVLITVAGGKFESNVQAILHVVSPSPSGTPPSRQRSHQAKYRGMRKEDEAAKSLLLQVYANCLRFAEGKLRLKSLALPLIGLGDFSMETCVQCFHDSLLLFLHENGFPANLAPSISLSTVHLIIPDARATDSAAELFQTCLNKISTPEAFSAAVSLVHDGYLKLSDLKRQVNVSHERLSDPTPSPAAGSEAEYAEDQEQRTASGRPRVKRRRL